MVFGRLALVSAAALLSITGCKKEESGSAAPTPAPAPQREAPAAAAAAPSAADLATEAQEIFASRCTPCHGPAGGGDGPASKGLTPPPRNFQDTSWQQSVTDDHIEKIISYGGAAVGKSAAMPPNPDLADKPVIKALREHIRTLKK